MSARCDHHEHDEDFVGGDVWRATSSHGSIIGDFCTDHLGDALDDFDGHVNLDRIDLL